jgi:hypothetical protein
LNTAGGPGRYIDTVTDAHGSTGTTSTACPGRRCAIVESVSAYWEAGFTDVALVQVGGETQDQFLPEAAKPPLDKPGDASK